MAIEIIAEAAQGYEGDPTLTRLLAKAAVAADADGVKFQIVYAKELAAPGYQYYDLFRQLEMPLSSWEAAAHIVKSAGKRLYFDVFGLRSLELAQQLGADGVKIHSTDFFNTELHQAALESMSQVFVSFGGITMEELSSFLDGQDCSAREKICLLYGFQAEPTPVESNNLRRLVALKRTFPMIRFGFMDHSDGSSDDAQSLALLALPLDVVCIEKHITLDRALELEDYPSAIAPHDFSQFVLRVRRLETALGSSGLTLTPPEQDYRQRALKVVIATRPLAAGHTLSDGDIALLRVAVPKHPAPLALTQVAGRCLTQEVECHQQITSEMLA